MSFPKILIKEGKIRLLIPDPNYYRDSKGFFDPSYAPVFYNPKMAFCRDLSVLVVQCFEKKLNKSLRICDPLTATGVRGLRYAAEVDNVSYVLLNDINPDAVKLALENVEINKLDHIVEVTCRDARLLLYDYAMSGNRFDVIDIDPFGSPVNFIEAAINATRINGLLCITATDMPPLCGLYPLACLRKYGGFPLKSDFCHEIAVRLVIASLIRKAAENDFSLDILLSHATDHYIRVYAVLRKSIAEANKAVEKLGFIVYCPSCHYRECIYGITSSIPNKCPNCKNELKVAGPLWCGPLLNKNFIKDVIKIINLKSIQFKWRAEKLLSTLLEEADGPPTYYILDTLASKLKISSPPVKELISFLKSKGYFASRTHFNPKGIRTDAPLNLIYKAIQVCQDQ